MDNGDQGETVKVQDRPAGDSANAAGSEAPETSSGGLGLTSSAGSDPATADDSPEVVAEAADSGSTAGSSGLSASSDVASADPAVASLGAADLSSITGVAVGESDSDDDEATLDDGAEPAVDGHSADGAKAAEGAAKTAGGSAGGAAEAGAGDEAGDAGTPGSRTTRGSVRDLEEEGEVAADYLEELLDIVDVDGDIDIDVENGRASLAIVAEGGSDRSLRRLVGANGEVLEALQELTRLAVQASTGERSRLMLDVAGHRAQRRKVLTDRATQACEQVKTSGQPLSLEPMSAFERKIVHDVVAEAGLESESEGVDPNRHVVVLPASS